MLNHPNISHLVVPMGMLLQFLTNTEDIYMEGPHKNDTSENLDSVIITFPND